MKSIQPISIWVNGSVKIATKFNLNITFDNLENGASFSYALLTDNEEEYVSQGDLQMNEQDYDNWDNSNDAAYVWGANKLGLTLI